MILSWRSSSKWSCGPQVKHHCLPSVHVVRLKGWIFSKKNKQSPSWSEPQDGTRNHQKIPTHISTALQSPTSMVSDFGRGYPQHTSKKMNSEREILRLRVRILSEPCNDCQIRSINKTGQQPLWKIWPIAVNHLTRQVVLMCRCHQQLCTTVMMLWCWLLTFRVCRCCRLSVEVSIKIQRVCTKIGRYPNLWPWNRMNGHEPWDFRLHLPVFREHHLVSTDRGLGGPSVGSRCPKRSANCPGPEIPDQPMLVTKNSGTSVTQWWR